MKPFLRVPPFPRRRSGVLALPDDTIPAPGDAELADIAEALREARVGGDFWAAWPELPAGRDILLAAATPDEARLLAGLAETEGVAARTMPVGDSADPWHLAEAAGEVWAMGDCDLTLVARLLGRRVRLVGEAGVGESGRDDALAQAFAGLAWRSPFTGAPIAALEAIALLGAWRRLIDANRTVAGIFGIAGWKRETLDALLWDGSGTPPYGGTALSRRMRPGEQALIWAARAARGLAAGLADSGARIGEIEDGFIRSSGLGANCVPPLSVVVDTLGSHVDPSRPSSLETLLAETSFPPDLVARAASLREALVAGGIGKYGAEPVGIADPPQPRPTPPPARRRVLVCGQVEDDRAVLLGGAGVTNLTLLIRARELEPDAEIVWRPHPDVEAGHRKGAIAETIALAHADRIERSASIAALFAQVQAVHVISSLAGFEALLRGLDVTVHGMPFYAGWGLTRDLAEVPARRGRRLALDELAAAALILYPRYLDPVSRLPCEPELLIARMAAGEAEMPSPLVTLRMALGRGKKLLTRLRGAGFRR